eukprot:COSAG02_NODE_458_length_21942_cov_1643.812068_14_plen_141_part_00
MSAEQSTVGTSSLLTLTACAVDSAAMLTENPEMATGQVMGQPGGCTAPPPMGGLSASNLAWSLQQSLVHLGAAAVDVFYLHQPDPATSLEETLRACHELHQQKKFARLGLSNYMAEEVAEACRLCGAYRCICCLSSTQKI